MSEPGLTVLCCMLQSECYTNVTVLYCMLQSRAREMRDERRASVNKVLKYLFQMLSHYLRVSKEEVEELILDDPAVSTYAFI